jgi:excisionase family DNA binding protein
MRCMHMTQITSLLTIPEFAGATGLSYKIARELVVQGDIPHVRVGRRRRIDVRCVHEWLARTQEAGRGTRGK